MAQGVSECVRGFSFMPETKVDVINLQYIEDSELAQAWKRSRRERLKSIETKIWDEFINDRDIVNSVSSDDPYQFLEQLPEECVREIMDSELVKMKKEVAEDTEQPGPQETESRDAVIILPEHVEDEQCDMFTILDDDDEQAQAGDIDDDHSRDSLCTVRETSPPRAPSPALAPHSVESVAGVVENSICSAKVKDLQLKLQQELRGVGTTLEIVNLSKVEPHELPRLQKQCSEFSARYSRVYLYPMSRQIYAIKRHNNAATPLARHTHTRSQLVRCVSLQQNMLQALQVFHKWAHQKPPMPECVYSLRNFIQLVKEADAVYPAEVRNEELAQECDGFNETLELYLKKLDNFLKDQDAVRAKTMQAGASKAPLKKKPFLKPGSKKTDTEARLSMYSLDKSHYNSKCSLGRSSGGSSKARLGPAGAAPPGAGGKVAKKKGSRRPLMRAPGGGVRREQARSSDNISTLVQAVEMGSSNTSPRPPAAGAASPPARHALSSRDKISKLRPHSGRSSSSTSLRRNPQSSTVVTDYQYCSSQSIESSKKDPTEIDSTSGLSSLLRKLCAGQSPSRARSQKDRASVSKNAQLLCINGGSPRQPLLGTPQLLRILEETIQKQAPKPEFSTMPPPKNVDRYLLSFSPSSKTTEPLFQYRTKFVQHMLASPMYANSALGKPWEMIGNISENIIDEILLNCSREMQLEIADELYKLETQ